MSSKSTLPTVSLRPAPLLEFRGVDNPNLQHHGETDSNSPAHWDGERLFVFHSAGHTWRSAGPDLYHLNESYDPVRYDNEISGGRWIECTWRDTDGTLYGWYHNEPLGICPERRPEKHLTAPRIGAARSVDNGLNWHDLGIILEAPADSLYCSTENHYFAGGNGDFSVMLDPASRYLYFFISTYNRNPAEQGVSVARMLYADRDSPVGKVQKWYQGKWEEPGLGGHVTPIFPAKTDWHRKDADAFWGPSIHWNAYLNQFVILLNRACDANWAQEGIYITFNDDLSHPEQWSTPTKILDGKDAVAIPAVGCGWYPQVMGIDKEKKETDKLAGRVARLFVHGRSRWEIVFEKK
jgi:hypothetical protein